MKWELCCTTLQTDADGERESPKSNQRSQTLWRTRQPLKLTLGVARNPSIPFRKMGITTDESSPDENVMQQYLRDDKQSQSIKSADPSL